MIMDISDFYSLVQQLPDPTKVQFAFGFGSESKKGLWIDYENNEGVRKQFRVINIASSCYPGCFEADCYSYYQSEKIEGQLGFCGDDMAITSHRTFKIANIISAKIC